MALYLDNGFLNIRYCLNFKCPFTFIIGGRATGKTFGALLTCMEDQQIFMLMRRTQAQADLISKAQFSPVNPVMDHMGVFPIVEPATKYNGMIYSTDDPESDSKIFRGYTAALSTFSNLRGFDGSGIDVLIYDEFIPERHERPIKNESDAFLNVYETINRNRELQGRSPLRALCLSNSNSLDSPILAGLQLTKVVERMESNHQMEWIHPQRGIAIFLLNQSPISQRKAQTALYRATAGSDFSKMSLGNEFAFDDMNDVKSLPLASGWKILFRLGSIYCYIKSGLWYLSAHGAGVPKQEYELTDIGIKKFAHDYPGSYQRIINHKIIYEDFAIKSIFTNIFI